eukprot:TRINITY_DN17967_c0_g1_i3.p1 TRINITY_DN17967_c0_g1~~TRINITY_DN17967_c0_g1_i3.p1  ORF type:complete len:119 (+),score=34.01 TRINITY_DN17967_c0_g1_i3:64-420(+)
MCIRDSFQGERYTLNLDQYFTGHNANFELLNNDLTPLAVQKMVQPLATTTGFPLKSNNPTIEFSDGIQGSIENVAFSIDRSILTLARVNLRDNSVQILTTQDLKTCLLYTSPSPRDQA